MDRDKIENKYKWDLSVIYSNIKEFNNDCDKVYKNIDHLASYEISFMKNAKNFYNALVLSYEY